MESIWKRYHFPPRVTLNYLLTIFCSIWVSTRVYTVTCFRAELTFPSAVHNFCTSQKATTNVQGAYATGAGSHRGGQSKDMIKQRDVAYDRGILANLLGEDLYRNLKEYLREHLDALLKQSNDFSDEALLAFYIKEWDRYTTAAKYTNHLFRYLNRHWVKREIDEGKKDVYDVYTLHLVIWKDEFFHKTHTRVMNAVLAMIEKQRNGEIIEQSQIKSIVDSFVSLGLDDSDSTKSTLDVYRYHFERPFLEATQTYYQLESQQFTAENSVVEYMKKAEARLEEERQRVGIYLHPDVMPSLMKTCLSVLVSDHSTLLREEFQRLLDTDRQEDLARMFRLLQKVPMGLEPLRTKFETHVRKAGEDSVEKVASEEESLDPKVYVDALLEVHSRFASLVTDAFAADIDFVKSLDNACKEFINRNKVCKDSTTKSPELLAKYSDSLLKKGAKNIEESELENMLSQLMTVFKFIEDKDVFQKFYTRMLAKRLVHTNSASDEAEISMIGKLKEACGFEYTNKLQRMLQDMQTSKDLNSNYKTWQENRLGSDELKRAVDPTYFILGTGFWPLTPPSTHFVPPEEIKRTYDRFLRFYEEKHSNRKLTWLWNLCKGEMKANYVKNTKVPYTFQVSTYQMGILLLFNDADTVTYDAIKENTKLAPEALDPSVAVLVKARVLIASPEGAKPESGTKYSLNYNFKFKKLKVNLNIAVKSEQKQEVEDTHKTIEEDRKLLMQVSNSLL